MTPPPREDLLSGQGGWRTGTPPRWMRLPAAGYGQRIGLFGGSFNPPHSGHALVSRTAMRRLELDQVWWMVTPGNPLKNIYELAPLETRVHLAAACANDPRVTVTAWEAWLGTAYSAQTVAALKRRRPDLKFVWVMGADNLSTFHRWQNWRAIIDSVPVAIVDRPGAELAALSAPAARTYARFRVPEEQAATLPGGPTPAWTFLHTPRDPASSTALRRAGKWHL